MLDRIANTFIAGVELLEAEGRVAREEATRLIRRAALIAALSLFLSAGLAALAVGLTWMLARQIGAAEAIALAGALVAAASGAILLVQARRLRRDQGTAARDAPRPTESDSRVPSQTVPGGNHDLQR